MAVACNISSTGRNRRRLIGYVGLGIGVAAAVAFVVAKSPWFVRLGLFLPVAGGTLSLLQARRQVCVAHAAAGTFEEEDMSFHKVDADAAAAARKVAWGIVRDAVAIGIVAAGVGALSAYFP